MNQWVRQGWILVEIVGDVEINYRGAGGNEKLDVKILLPPPRPIYMYRNLYILYHLLSQWLFQCTCLC
jgi:hypothetical protein